MPALRPWTGPAVAVLAWLALAPLSAQADKSGTRPNVVSAPTGPGSVGGLGESFEVNLNSGSATERVPLALPPGTGGMAPSLALSYDSGAGNGAVGIGWSFPISFIQVKTEEGLPKYDGTELFVLDGAELVPVAGGYYREKNEGAFIRAKRSGAGWEVNLPGGTVRRYGLDPEARIESGASAFAWYLEDEIDVFGNRVSYFYTKGAGGQPYLARIEYNRRTGAADNQVVFDYERNRSTAGVPITGGVGVRSGV